jgi:aminopeptidase-like protein
MNDFKNPDFINLTRDLCVYATGVVADDNEGLFQRIAQELPLEIFRFNSGDSYNGWLVPENWRVSKALIKKDGKEVFDGMAHTLGVGRYSKSFSGELDWAELEPYLVTNPDLPDAYMFHCMWQYRPWDAEWALSVPYNVFNSMGPGRYSIELETHYEPGEMIVAHSEVKGRTDQTIVFHSNTCHPHMANDGFAGTALLIRLMQWIQTQNPYYSYRLVLGPEHLGTVFYLRDMPQEELYRMLCGVFEEMPGTGGAINIASTFLGEQFIDRAFANALRSYSRDYRESPWRIGAGNDETVWEAPGYEVPFVEVTRSESIERPYKEYHSSLDTADLMNNDQIQELYEVFKAVVRIFENNATIKRKFDGLICLSNPEYDLYQERYDPTIKKDLPEDSEKWGYLQDCLLRYMDGTKTILQIAEQHALPFDRVHNYLCQFENKGLIDFEFSPVNRAPASKRADS